MAITADPVSAESHRLWTYDELVAELPESNQPMELWDGELITPPTPRPNHQRLTANFCQLLDAHVRQHGLGRVFISPLDVVLSQRRVVQPDVFYIARGNPAYDESGIRGVPDLVAEIISPGSWKRDRIEKRGLYEQFKVREYWLIDPETSGIDILSLQGVALAPVVSVTGDTVAESPLLPGFAVSFRQLLV